MLRKPICALSLAFLAVVVGCGPPLEPRFEPGFNCFSHLESTPIIAVVKVEPNTDSIIGAPVKRKSVPLTPVVLCKVRTRIENVIKGSAPLGDADVFYFSAQMPHGPGSIGFSGPETSREMLLLRRERGKLRMGMDISSACKTGVYSGAHPEYRPRPGEPPGEQMIDLLLTPGAGATDLGMIRAIFDRIPFVISPDYTAKTLLKLAALPSPVVRTAACLEFRDILAEEGAGLSDQFGVSKSDLKRWQAQEEQNTPARFWWAQGPRSWAVPTTPLHAGNLTGMSLCTNDKALGVPPLRSPSAATEFRPQPLPTVLH